ncbi:hypothetical protein [Allomuricauda sp. M10]|uniref:hypothetical protein n=1 Tax=Allomuricauda sp. M10 TaxID=2683292 RepID=UPI001D187242|nr:hypothetical protein [Muricauda sp. M10]
MTVDRKILMVLGYDAAQMENRIMEDWMRWCQSNSYSISVVQTMHNGFLEFRKRDDKDLQNLMADASLFRFWMDVYLDCLLDFVDFVQGMNPSPTHEEARQILNRSVIDTHRLFSKQLLNNARSKKIDLCAKQN